MGKRDKAKRTTVVVAGSYAQFRNWCHENAMNPMEAVFCEPMMRDVSRLRGLDAAFTTLSLYGTYYEGREWPDVERQLVSQRLLAAPSRTLQEPRNDQPT